MTRAKVEWRGWAMRKGTALVFAALTGMAGGCAPHLRVALARSPGALTVQKPALYPETIEYDRTRGKFLLGSFREGAVYEVDDEGKVARAVEDPRLCSVLGIAVDAERGRLWVVNGDLGASVRPSAAGPKQLAAVGVYELATGRPIHYVDLAPLAPGPHLPNGIALDRAGNAYVTDSFAGAVYAIEATGEARVLLRDEAFTGEGIGLNGLVVHPDGYLLVVDKRAGALFKVPLESPSRFTRVAVARSFVGGDGLLLVGTRELVVIANQTPSGASNAAFSLASDDAWASASLRAVHALGDVYPTTGVLRDGTLYVLHSKLDELLKAPAAQKDALHLQATIEPIGTVAR